MNKDVKKEEVQTSEQLEALGVRLASKDVALSQQIDNLTKERNGVRKERRSVEGKLVTIKINEKAK